MMKDDERFFQGGLQLLYSAALATRPLKALWLYVFEGILARSTDPIPEEVKQERYRHEDTANQR